MNLTYIMKCIDSGLVDAIQKNIVLNLNAKSLHQCQVPGSYPVKKKVWDMDHINVKHSHPTQGNNSLSLIN